MRRSFDGTLAVTALAPVSWGTTYLVTTELLPDGRPLLAGLLRALPAGIGLTLLSRVRPHGVWWARTAALGTLYIGAFFPLLFFAAYRLPGGMAATLGSVGPLLAVALAALLLRERPTRRKVLAGLAGVIGVALVMLQPGARVDLAGVAAGLAGALSMTSGTVLAKRWGRPDGVGALAFTGWQLVAGGLVILPLVLLVEGLPPSITTGNVAGFGYLTVVNTGTAYWLWFRGIERLAANSITFLALASPVTAATIGWAVLGQSLSWVQIVGITVACTASWCGARPAGERGARRRRGQVARPPVLVAAPAPVGP